MAVQVPGLVRRLRELGEEDDRIKAALMLDLALTDAEAQAVLDDPQEQIAPIDVREQSAQRGARRGDPPAP